MKIGFNSRKNPDTCTHDGTITVSASGIERVICEACGFVSVNFEDELVSTVAERTSFARDADTQPAHAAPVPVGAGHGVKFGFMASSA